jgi:hypothetical protein
VVQEANGFARRNGFPPSHLPKMFSLLIYGPRITQCWVGWVAFGLLIILMVHSHLMLSHC